MTENEKRYLTLSSMGVPKTNLFLAKNPATILSNCSKGQYFCHGDGYCINIDMICDGISHCYQGDDEHDCSRFFLLLTHLPFFMFKS